MVNEDINNPQEFAGKLFLLTQKVPEIMNEEEILADLISFHEQQVKLEVEKCERQKKTYEQEKFYLGNKNEELNISLQEKVEEVRKLQTELSREKKTSESLAQEIKEKDKLFEEEKDKLNDLVKQSDDKVKLVVSRSTEIRKGSSKISLERELNSAKAELAEKTGKYEKTIAKLQGEKTKAEKRVRELETTNKEKERLKSDLAGLQKKLDKEIEEKKLFQEKNRELTKKLSKEGSSSLSSQIGSATNSSSDSLPNFPQKKTFGVSLRKGAKNIFPTKVKKDKVASDTSKGKEKLSLASELNGVFNNSPDETLERQKLSAESSVLDGREEYEIHVNNSFGSAEQETTKVSEVNDYKRVKEELEITRQELRVLEQENKRQLNSLKEKDEEIQKLKSAKENEKIKKSFSFPDLKSLNNSKSSRLKDELAITKAEKNILEQEVLNKEFKAERLKEREKERSQKFNEIKNEFEEAAREVKFYSDDLKFLEQEVEKSQVVNAGNLSQIKRISKSRSTPVLNKNQQKTSPNFTWEFLKQDPYSNEVFISEKEQNTSNEEFNQLKKQNKKNTLELEKKEVDKQEENDWETASSFSSPTDSIFSHHSRDGSESSIASESSYNLLPYINKINILESEIGSLKKEKEDLKNQLEKSQKELIDLVNFAVRKDYLEDLENKYESLIIDYNKLEDEKEVSEKKTGVLEEQLKNLTAEKGQAEVDLKAEKFNHAGTRGKLNAEKFTVDLEKKHLWKELEEIRENESLLIKELNEAKEKLEEIQDKWEKSVPIDEYSKVYKELNRQKLENDGLLKEISVFSDSGMNCSLKEELCEKNIKITELEKEIIARDEHIEKADKFIPELFSEINDMRVELDSYKSQSQHFITTIITELELIMPENSSLDQVIEVIKNLIRSPNTNEANEEIKDELEDTKNQIEEVETELDFVKKEKDELQVNLDEKSSKINILFQQNTEFLNSLRKAEEEIAKFKRENNFQHNIEVN